MLSPGVFVTEIDASTIVPTVSNSIGVFAGDFVKGPVDTYVLITSVSELITYYGYPTNDNYNDWYQAYNFLQYGNKLLVSRAANVGGTETVISGCTVSGAHDADDTTVTVSTAASLTVGDLITFGDAAAGSEAVYEIVALVGNIVTLDRGLDDAVAASAPVNSWVQ